MNGNDIDLKWEGLRRYAQDNIPRLLFVTVSGAHLYGFPSEDSDIDLRGTFAAPLTQVLSLNKPKETLEPKGVVEDTEVELVGHEIEKYLRLLVKPNGYVLEQILSPLVVLTSSAHEELKSLAEASLSKRLYYHYSGFARSEWRDYEKNGTKTVKRLLYLYRVLMTGIVLLREGIMEANLWHLNARFGLPLVPLVALKTREFAEAEGDMREHEANIRILFIELDTACEASQLPDDVPSKASLSDFLVRVRLGHV